MAWGAAQLWWCARVACALVCGCLLLLAPAWAQNSAEKESAPKKSQPAKEAEQQPAKNSAEKSAKPEESKPVSGPTDPPPEQQPAPAPATPGAAKDEDVEAAPTEPPAGPNVGPTAPPQDGEAQPPAGGNAAEAPPPVAVPGAGAAPPPEKAGAATPGANAAEARPAGGTAGNAAQTGPDVDASGAAVPPAPPFSLPTPGATAGEIEDYQPPELILQIPGMDLIPDVLPEGAYNSPQRDYLLHRPLPGMDVDETEQERIARNIEESLKQIDLTVETRPDSGVTIPLPSGIVTFKAAQAFQFDRRNRILTFTGDAEILFGDVAIWADLIEVNDSAATAYAKGYVAVQQRDEIIYADEAYYNYDTGSIELFYIEGNSSGPRLQGRLYYQADRAYGTLDRLIMEKAEITTCDPFCGTTDEYHLSAHKVVLKRNTSVVLHDVYIYIRSHKVGYIPLIAIPLPRNQRYTQEESDVNQSYGYNNSDGFFAKFAYTYSTRYVENVQQPLKGVIKLDMLQNRGAGFGIRQDFYTSTFGVTTIRAFYQQDWPLAVARAFGRKAADAGKDFDFELDQELNLSRYVQGSLKIDRTNTFNPSSTVAGAGTRTNTWSNNFSLNYQKNKTQATLSANQNLNILGGYTRTDGTLEPSRETNTANAKVGLMRDFGDGLKFTFDESYTSNKGGSGREGLPADREGSLSMSLDWNGSQMNSGNRAQNQPGRAGQQGSNQQGGSQQRSNRWNGWGARLTYKEPAIDWDREKNTTDQNVSINKEIPSLAITLPPDLLGDGAYFNRFSIDLNNLVTGRRRDPSSIFRAKVSIGGGDRISFSRSSNLNTRLDFDQYWYDDGNAQYSVRPSLNYSYDSFDWFKFDTSWNWNYRQGVKEPPVASDRTTISQSMSYGLGFTNRRSWRGQLRGGYDIEGDRFNPISMEFHWDPNKVFGLTATTSLVWDIDTVTRQNAQGQNVSDKLKRFKFNPLRVSGYLRSPYVDPEGFYNWFLAWGITNDFENGWDTTELTTRYYRKLDRGWSTEILGGYRQSTDPPIDFSEKFARNYIKRISVRKTNCCTTLEGGWNAGAHEFYLNVYLNALPQYPGLVDLYRTSTTSAEGTKYEYAPNFMFPINPVMNDILQDQFGMTNPFGGSSLF